MSVDYSAVFGIGVKIKKIIFEDDTNIEDYFEKLLNGTILEFNKYGKERYNGKDNTYCIFIKEPFEYGISGLKIKMDFLENFLIENNIQYYDDIDIVGGLLID